MAKRSRDERRKVLESTIAQVERAHGKGSLMWLGDDTARLDVEVIPSGSLGLDIALGVGGLPRGRMVEIYGPEGSGKTTMGLHIIAEAQKLDGLAAFIDAEHAMPAEYARKLGVDLDNLLISQPDTGEQALEIAEQLIRSGAVDIVVIDSVAALVPRIELEGEMGDTHVALQARMMSQALRKLTGVISKSATCAVFINQLREKIGVMFGSPETTPGGRALKFYSSIRLDIRRIAAIKEKDKMVGNRTRVKVAKNKVAAPFRTAEFDIIYNQGISREGEILDLGVELELVTKSGTWFSFDDERLGQGRDNAKLFLADHPDLRDKLELLIRRKVGLAPADEEQTSAEDEKPTDEEKAPQEA